MAQKDKEILLLIDSYALIHRAFHAFDPSLTTSKGEVVNAVYGFARLLLEVLQKFKPDYAIAAMDSAGPTIRHQQYGAYKANRKPTDDTLTMQVPRIEQLLQAFDIPTLKVAGFEADDIIGTLDARHSGEGKHTIIVTGDRDLFQLVDEDTSVYLAGSAFSQSQLFDPAAVKVKMGLRPDQIVDLKSLMGDQSDNIPGVAGIGEKGAVGLLEEYDNLENLYQHVNDVATRYKNKLENSYEIAKLSQTLATIQRDIPMSFDFKDAPFGTYNKSELVKFFQELEFKSLLAKVQSFGSQTESGEEVEEVEATAQEYLLPKDLKAWDGSDLGNDIALVGEYALEGDPLHWKFSRLCLMDREQCVEIELNKEVLANLLAKIGNNEVITFDGKLLLHCLENTGVRPSINLYDLVLSTYVLSAGASEQSIAGVGRYYRTGLSDLSKIVWEVYDKQTQTRTNQPKLADIVKLENNLCHTVVQMERAGVRIDVDFLKDYQGRLEEVIGKTEKQIYDTVGHEFNIASPKQVGQVLFEELSLPAGKKTKTGSYSTDERTLREISYVHPVIDMILRYRELTKLLSTYVKPLPEYLNTETRRVHATFKQMGAVTGRFSSTNPNMQNIPFNEVEGLNMRNAFLAEQGKVLVTFDYSQQELRLLAELSGEQTMQQAFREGRDIHAAAAAEIFDIDIDKVTKEQRRIGKTINFGVVYGISAFGLSDRLKIDNAKAAEFIKKYFATYPRVKEYYNQLVDQARVQGYVETIFGRRRDTADLNARNMQLRRATEREVMNFPLQGSAADVIKQAMCDLTNVLSTYPVKLILQVHDELVFEYETEHQDPMQDPKLQQFIADTKNTMLNVVKLQVPFEVGVAVGTRWGDMK